MLKRLNTDSEQAQHGGNTTFTEQQQTMAFGGGKGEKVGVLFEF